MVNFVRCEKIRPFFTFSDSDWANDSNKGDYRLFLVAMMEYQRCFLGIHDAVPLTVLNSGEIEMVAAFSGACEGMGLIQLRHSGSEPASIANTCLPLNCSRQRDPAQGSTRKTKHIDVKASLQWSARPQVCIVWAGANEHLADC